MRKRILVSIIFVILAVLACSPVAPEAQPTPQLTELTSGPQRSAALLPAKPAYLAERVRTLGDYPKLAANGVTLIVESFSINLAKYGKVSDWRAMFQAAQDAGIGMIVVPSDWTYPRAACNWPSPFPLSTDGQMTSVLTGFLDVAVQYPSFVGIMAHHETNWTCKSTIQEVKGINVKLHEYLAGKGREDVKIYNYIGGTAFLSDTMTPPAEIDNLGDVIVIWKHCWGNAEGLCSSTVGMLQQARAKMTAAGSTAQLAYLIQTFTSEAPWNVKPGLAELEALAKQVIDSGTVDIFGLYTVNADWWPDIYDWPDIQPIIPYVGGLLSGTPMPSTTPAPPSLTPTITKTRTPAPPTNTPGPTNTPAAGAFTFVSLSDAQGISSTFGKTVAQAKTLNPAFYIFNGDLENDGVTASEMAAMTAPLAGLDFKAVRGNHDNHVSGSAALWDNYFDLSYNFEYGNSVFIGVDVPGAIQGMTTAQINQVDAQLTSAEQRGLTHAFLFFHGPAYCVESVHCACTGKADGSCTPAQLVTMLNKHPIVSALFSGHEHILGWVHMDSARVPTLTGAFEQFLTSPSGGYTYNSYIYPNRLDYYYPSMGNGQGFGAITVDGNLFTVNLYKTGGNAPVWSRMFVKGAASPTNTPGVVTSTPTATKTPIPPTITPECKMVLFSDGTKITVCK